MTPSLIQVFGCVRTSRTWVRPSSSLKAETCEWAWQINSGSMRRELIPSGLTHIGTCPLSVRQKCGGSLFAKNASNHCFSRCSSKKNWRCAQTLTSSDNVIEIDKAIPTNPSLRSGISEEEDFRGGTKDPHSAEGLRSRGDRRICA